MENNKSLYSNDRDFIALNCIKLGRLSQGGLIQSYSFMATESNSFKEYFFIEPAKLRAILANVPACLRTKFSYVPTWHGLLRANVPACQRAKFTYAPTCHGLVTCQCASVPAYQILFRANVPWLVTCQRASVPTCQIFLATCQRAMAWKKDGAAGAAHQRMALQNRR